MDFIVYGEHFFYAIEVKNSDKISNMDLRALKTFHDDYPEATPILLYRGKDKIVKGGVICWPVTEFLRQLVPDRFPL